MKKIVLFFILFVIPISTLAKEDLISNAQSGILIEANSGKILYEKNKDSRVSVASMTKMVAQIIILEEIEKGNIHWTDMVVASRNASDMGGSQIYLEEGEKMSVEDLMKGISVASGNDATVAMAEYISGTEEKFVKRMNQKIKELGLKNTHFVNCTGLDEDNHYSSSYDMAMIARELVVNHPNILKYSSIYEDYLRKDTDRKFWLVNTNKLISQYDGTDGLKTGHTDNAGYCLAATVKKNNIRLIGIVLGEKDSKVRNQETIQLLDYGFQNTKLTVLKKKNSVVKKVPLEKCNQPSIDALLKNDLAILEDTDSNYSKIQYQVKLYSLSFPIKKGDSIGKIVALSDGKVLSQENLISSNTVSKMDLFHFYQTAIRHLLFGDY